jgi:nucleoside-diphosphate-sugar epimerase
MKTLIIGGSGFVSGTLAQLAVEQGHQVWTVTRGQRALPSGVTALIADRSDGAAFQQAIATADVRWDLVVDCIGYQPGDVEQDIAAFAGRAAQLIFVSTDFVFDPAHRRFPQSEQTEHYAGSGYGGNKRLCEQGLQSRAPMAWRGPCCGPATSTAPDRNWAVCRCTAGIPGS